MSRKRILILTATVVMLFAVTEAASAACTFTTVKKTMTLTGNCTTTSSIVVPNGFTLDGAGYTITAMDPLGDHFRGGVIENGGANANVTNLTVTVSGLTDACDAGDDRLRGILFNGASGSITNVKAININQGASGCQEGNAIEVRNFGASATTNRVTIDGNTATGYQKTGIVANGDVDATITNNTVDGLGPVGHIARNGIQIGFGGTGMIKRNTVAGNSYTGSSTVSGGILVVGGPGYGGDFCVNIQVDKNVVTGNDIGVYISQYEADFSAPASATNIKVINNEISNNAVNNGYIYQAGVSDVGNNDKIIANTISGPGYDPNTIAGATFNVDADESFTNRPKVHANK